MEIELYSNIYCFKVNEQINLNKMIVDAGKNLGGKMLHENQDPNDEEKARTILMIE